jgi:hypothetical protein
VIRLYSPWCIAQADIRLIANILAEISQSIFFADSLVEVYISSIFATLVDLNAKKIKVALLFNTAILLLHSIFRNFSARTWDLQKTS